MYKRIIVPVYFIEEDSGKKIIDEECMREEFEEKLNEVLKNINKWKWPA